MNDFFVSLMLMGALSSGNQMPFWSYANEYDLHPRTSGYTALLQTGQPYDNSKDFTYHWEASGALRGDSFNWTAFIPDQAYAGIKWKNLALDLGLKHPDRLYLAASPTLGSLSVTSGNIINSGNARSMPGYTLSLKPANFPWTKGHLQVAAAFGDYFMTDARIEGRTLTHNTQLSLIGHIGPVDITVGIDHWAQWKGDGFLNYLRVITGSSAGKDGTLSDRVNVIGNQLGAEKIAIAYNGKGYRIEFRHDIPYDDKSGMIFKNFPDGVNTLCFSFDDKDRWVSDILYEFQYTMYQSGSIQDRDYDEQGRIIPWHPGLNYWGGDNYFNNGEFKNGWTHYGMTVGNPLFYPCGTRDRSWSRSKPVPGVENNRLKSHHLGLSGKLSKKVPYRLMATYSLCYGTYAASYAGENPWGKPWGSVKETPLSQLSLGFSCEIPFLNNKILFVPGIYFDHGEVLGGQFAMTLGLRYLFHK